MSPANRGNVAAHLVGLVGQYGYAIIAFFLFAEGLAIPLPTDTTVVTASALAARGHLSLALVFLVATLATWLGTTAAYYVGRNGSTFLERHAHGGAAALQRAHQFFGRHGPSAVLFGRFIPVVRMFVSFVAGVSAMDARRFTLFNLAGAGIWAVVFCAIGYFFGSHRAAFYHQLVRAGLVVGLAIATLVTVAVAGGWLVEDADAAWRAEGRLWHRVLMSTPVRWLAARSPAAQRFLFQRFSPAHYLGINLTLGLGLTFVLLLLFGWLGQVVLASEALTRVDLALVATLSGDASPRGVAFWSIVTGLGSFPVMIALGAAAVLPFASRRAWLAVAGWLAALAGSELLTVVLRHRTPRLHVELARYGADSMVGLPSGHSLGAVVGYGLIAYFLVLLLRTSRGRALVIGGAAALVLAIAFSRLYLGRHFFSDVVAGLAAGAVWLTACLTGLEVARRKAASDAVGAAARSELSTGR
jgi:undecaprenyl-diphosphatase